MFESLNGYDNDIIKAAGVRTAVFGPKQTAVFEFVSGKMISLTPTHPFALYVLIEMNGLSLSNPQFSADNDAMFIHHHGGYSTFARASENGLVGVKFMRVQGIDLWINSRNIIESVQIKGDIDSDRLGKRLNFANREMHGVATLKIDLMPNKGLANSNLKEIGLVLKEN